MSQPRYFAIILAAGIGSRMKSSTPKPYLLLNNQPIIQYAIDLFLEQPRIEKIMVVLNADDQQFSSLNLTSNQILTTTGGNTRAQSVLNGITALTNQTKGNDWILVHDAARPCLKTAALDRLIDSLIDEPVGGLLAVPARDTLKQASDNQQVIKTLPRAKIWQAQTPQLFRYQLLKDALTKAAINLQTVTDEASAIEMTGKQPKLIMGDHHNIKITYPEDLALAQMILTL